MTSRRVELFRKQEQSPARAWLQRLAISVLGAIGIMGSLMMLIQFEA